VNKIYDLKNTIYDMKRKIRHLYARIDDLKMDKIELIDQIDTLQLRCGLKSYPKQLVKYDEIDRPEHSDSEYV
jgi:hypothetical protein